MFIIIFFDNLCILFQFHVLFKKSLMKVIDILNYFHFNFNQFSDPLNKNRMNVLFNLF